MGDDRHRRYRDRRPTIVLAMRLDRIKCPLGSTTGVFVILNGSVDASARISIIIIFLASIRFEYQRRCPRGSQCSLPPVFGFLAESQRPCAETRSTSHCSYILMGAAHQRSVKEPRGLVGHVRSCALAAHKSPRQRSPETGKRADYHGCFW